MDKETRFRFDDKMNYALTRPTTPRINPLVALEIVEREELVRQVVNEEWVYLFKHALVQDAAYSTLMKQERKRLHKQVAESLENLYENRLDDFALLLAQHYAEAGDAGKTFLYAVQAGTAAARRSANAEARTNYDMALEALAELPDTVQNQRDRVETILKRIAITLRSEGPLRSLERLQVAEALAQEMAVHSLDPQDELLLARVRYWIAQAQLYGGETALAIGYLKQVLTVTQGAANDKDLSAAASSVLGRGLDTLGRFSEAEAYLRFGADQLDMFAMNHEWQMAVGGLGLANASRGAYAQGVAEGQRALEGAMQVNLLTSIALAHFWLGLIYQTGGDFARLAKESALILEIAEKTGDRLLLYIGFCLQASAQSNLGQHQAAFESMEKYASLAKQMGGRLVMHEVMAARAAEIAWNAGLMEDALVRSKQALALALESDCISAQGLAERTWGQVLAADNGADPVEIESHFVASLNAFLAGDARIDAARTHLVWGKYLNARGNKQAARKHIESAAAQFRLSGLDQELHQANELLQ